jgi:hypothetical protein
MISREKKKEILIEMMSLVSERKRREKISKTIAVWKYNKNRYVDYVEKVDFYKFRSWLMTGSWDEFGPSALEKFINAHIGWAKHTIKKYEGVRKITREEYELITEAEHCMMLFCAVRVYYEENYRGLRHYPRDCLFSNYVQASPLDLSSTRDLPDCWSPSSTGPYDRPHGPW